MEQRIIDPFSNHKITSRFEDNSIMQFICRNEKSSTYWFGVIITQGFVILYGDIGELILRRPSSSAECMLQWLGGSINGSIYYILEKVSSSMRDSTYEFNEQDAIRVIDDSINEEKERITPNEKVLESLRELRDDVQSGHCSNGYSWTISKFIEALYEVVDGDDLPYCRWPSTQTMYKIAALRKFCELVDIPYP